MAERDDYEALFIEHLPFIERVIGAVARGLGFRDDDADDFASWAKERLWDGDYQVLRKWRGESRLTTYLTTVVTMLGREFRVKHWGRWRPSAAARQGGALAIRLETLVYRDGLRLAEAGELLRTRGETDLSDRELAARLASVPVRARPRRGDDREVPIEGLAGHGTADDAVDGDEHDATRRRIYAVLAEALRRLDPEARLLIELQFRDGRSIADIARAFGAAHQEQKRLYRVSHRALAALGRFMDQAGVTRTDVQELFGLPLPPRTPYGDDVPADSEAPWPSNPSCDSNPEADGDAPPPHPSGRSIS